MEFYAHSGEGKPKSEWQGLEEHPLFLLSFPRRRESRSGAVAGLWHDLGNLKEELTFFSKSGEEL